MAGKEVTLSITITEDHQIRLGGPLKNTILCVYLLEKAKLKIIEMEELDGEEMEVDSRIEQVKSGLIVPGMKS